MGVAEFIIGPAEGRTRWLHSSYALSRWLGVFLTGPTYKCEERYFIVACTVMTDVPEAVGP
jgi:hypothetical protein